MDSVEAHFVYFPYSIEASAFSTNVHPLRAGNNNRYFDFKYLKICAKLNIPYNFLWAILYGYF